jgi:hypothetical protein
MILAEMSKYSSAVFRWPGLRSRCSDCLRARQPKRWSLWRRLWKCNCYRHQETTSHFFFWRRDCVNITTCYRGQNILRVIRVNWYACSSIGIWLLKLPRSQHITQIKYNRCNYVIRKLGTSVRIWECRLLGCGAVWVYYKRTFRRNVSHPSSG